MAAEDHHTAYLTRAVAALAPEGRERAIELLDQLAEAARADERVVQFAAARRVEVASGRVDASPADGLTQQELEVLLGGFLRIRDQERRDDVGDWANAVVALLEDGVATFERGEGRV